MLIVATAILVTVPPVLRRSSHGARRPEPRVSPGADHSEGPVLVAENVAEPQAAPAGAHGPFRAPWGGGQRWVFTRRARDRQDSRQPRADVTYDEYEVEQMVRERLYGRRGRQR